MPHEHHLDNVLRDGAHFAERNELRTAGVLYATSLVSWIPDDDRGRKADAIRKRWNEGEEPTLEEVEGLRRDIEALREEMHPD
jgi:hypothetical protein